MFAENACDIRFKDSNVISNHLSSMASTKTTQIFGTRKKSKSDSDLYTFSIHRKSLTHKSKDYDDSSASPTNSDVTVIRVQRNSQAKNVTAKRTCGGMNFFSRIFFVMG